MARDPRFDILFEPVRIGPKVLRNRFYAVPHSCGFGVERPASQAAFRAMKAEGGWAAVSVEITSIEPESDRNPVPQPVRLWDDDDLASLSATAAAVRAHGALAGIELWHAGSALELNPTRLQAVGASAVPNDAYVMTYPEELDHAGIRRVQGAYAEAARRARAAGFDIVYVYGAHGYLPLQFLSSFYNRREDAYGGSLTNRARFWRETLEVVRDAVGDACAIAVRLGIDEEGPAGVPLAEALPFVRMVDDLVDLWDVNTSAIARPALDMRPARSGPPGYQVEVTGRLREATAKPIVGVERLTDPARMAEIVRSGAWDLIGGARPSIADPFLPRKIEDGRLGEIRECIGCNVCIVRAGIADHIGCTQNATAGEEHRRGWHPERFAPVAGAPRDVLVVGGGPAGMECARVLGERGVRAHLVEADDELGGHVRLLAALPGLGEWRRVIDYRVAALRRLRGVEVVTGVRLDAAAVRDYGADIAVVATGAAWSRDGASPHARGPLPGVGLPGVVACTPEDVVAGALATEPRDVLVYDCEGHLTGVGVAELLAGRGHRVRLVTPSGLVAPYLERTFEGSHARAALHRLGAVADVATVVRSLAPGSARLATYGVEREVAADAVVLVTSRVPDDALRRALAAGTGGGPEVRAIGDCAAPRLTADAIFDGHRLARELGEGGDGRPLPFLRERLVLPRTAV